MKQSQLIRVEISAVVCLEKPVDSIRLNDCATEVMLDAVQLFASKALNGVTDIAPGAKIKVTFAKATKN